MEIKKEVEDLSYRSIVAVNIDMSDFDDSGRARYNKNTRMLSESIPKGGRFYPMLDFDINYDKCKWKEDPVNVNLLGVTITPAQFAEFNKAYTLNTKMVPERETGLINDLFPPDETVFFYSNCKAATDEKSRVQRSFTFGRDNDTNIKVNPYNTVPVYGIEPVFMSGTNYYTFGLESIVSRLYQIQVNLGNYADSIIGDILELLQIDPAQDVSKTLILVNKILQNRSSIKEDEDQKQGLIDVLTADKVFYNKFREALLNSDKVAYYGSNLFSSDQKRDFKAAFERGTPQNDSLRRILFDRECIEHTLYYIDEDWNTYLIEEAVIKSLLGVLKAGNVTTDTTIIELAKKRIRVAIRLSELVNGLNRMFNRMLKDIIVGDPPALNPDPEYSVLISNANGLIRSLESVYTAGLQIGNHFLWNLDNEITHRRARIPENPVSGKLIFLSDPLATNILMENAQKKAQQESKRDYAVDEGGLMEYGETKFRKTDRNNIEGKSLVFKIPNNAGNECEMTFFLLKAGKVDYNTSSCLITFEKVAVTIGDKCFNFHSPYAGLNPYYFCHYIHSVKDNDNRTLSAIRLELLPETNIPEAAKRDILPQESILNTVCSRIYYIPVSSFENYNVQIGEMYKDSNELVTNLESLNGEVRVQFSVDKNFHVCIKKVMHGNDDLTNKIKEHESKRLVMTELISVDDLKNFGTVEEKEMAKNARVKEMKPKKLSKKNKTVTSVAERLDNAALEQLMIKLDKEDVEKNSNALFELFGKKKDEK